MDQLPSGNYRVRYRSNGRWVTEGTYPTKAKALTASKRVERADHLGEVTYNTRDLRQPLSTWWEPWCAQASQSRRTLDNYRSFWNNWLLLALGSKELRDIDRVLVRNFVAAMRQAGAGRRLVQQVVGVLAMLIDFAYEDLGVSDRANPARKLDLPGPVPSEKRFLTIQQVEALAEAIGTVTARPRNGLAREARELLDAGHSQGEVAAKLGMAQSTVSYHAHRSEPVLVNHLGLLVRFAAATGLRAGELAALRPCDLDLDLDEPIVIVSGSIEQGGRRKTTKTGKVRSVPIPEFLRDPLRTRLSAATESVFEMPTGGPISHPVFYRTYFKPAAAAVGLPDLRFHDLRHTYAALLIANDAKPLILQQRLGHASVEVTLNVYGHIFPHLDRQVTDALNQAWVTQAS